MVDVVDVVDGSMPNTSESSNTVHNPRMSPRSEENEAVIKIGFVFRKI